MKILGILSLGLLAATWGVGSASGSETGVCIDPDRRPSERSGAAVEDGAPEYYQFPLVSTRRVPGAMGAQGVGEVAFRNTPFGVAVTADGSYRYDFTVRFERMSLPRDGAFVVWVSTPTLDEIRLVGELTDPAEFSGQVGWNKFLVIVTYEPAYDPDAKAWSGPVVIRGMSRSGLMHTMAGHGPFEQENCAAFGY